MTMNIKVKEDPFVVHMPDYADTNMTYEALWDHISEEWKISPVPLRKYEEAMPF